MNETHLQIPRTEQTAPPDARTTLAIRLITGIVLVVGMAARVRDYTHNRALWLDEAMLSLNILNRSPRELIQPLDWSQAAPPGFLMLEKIVLRVDGSSEMALRLVPLLAGITALLVFWPIARRLVGPAAGLLAVTMFALSTWLIYYSAEVKQYSVETLTTVILLALFARAAATPTRSSTRVALVLVGALAPWFAFPAPFVLAGMGATLLVYWYAGKERGPFTLGLISAGVWLASFALLYVLVLAAPRANQTPLREYWQALEGAYAPLFPFTPHAVQWYNDYGLRFFSDPLGFDAAALALLMFAVGIHTLWKKDRQLTVMLGAPFAVALGVSAAQLYPIYGRTALYLAPLAYLFIARGITTLVESHRAAGAVCLVVLFTAPTLYSLRTIAHPADHEELRSVLQHVQEKRAPGEPILVYYGAEPAFRYYVQRGTITPGAMTVMGTRSERGSWQPSAQRLLASTVASGKRFWLVFSHVYTLEGVNEEQVLLRSLNSKRVVLDRTTEEGAGAFLIGGDSASR